jgi:protein-disulfide isomerase
MPRSYVALVSACIGLAASVASLIDSLGAQPTFCAASGCETVRASWWAHPFGVPMPALGVAFFAAMLALAVVERPLLRWLAAVAGGLWAVGLIAVQGILIGAWCKLCLVSDVAAILHAAAVIAGARALPVRRAALGVPIIAAAVLALPVVTAPEPMPDPPADTPAFIVREQRPDQVTIVEFVDFECPYCRKLATDLDTALAQVRPVHLVRKMMPLPFHDGAIPAALAWCCADAQGKGDAMAHALFNADPSELTTAGCERIAARIGVDLDRYRKDLAAPATRDRIKADLTDAADAKVRGLPTLFVNGVRLVGAGYGSDELVDVIRSFY